MLPKITRRQALRGMATAGALALTRSSSALSSGTPIRIQGKPVEVVVAPAGSRTVRITVMHLSDGASEPLLQDGAIEKDERPRAAGRFRTLTGTQSFPCGQMQVRVSDGPLTIRVERPGGELVQELRLDPDSGELEFALGDGPILGLGQGGPQFDRRGSSDNMVSGQAGYQLGTHGARVPIQLLLGTSGWGMFVHRPLGGFALSGKEGRLHPGQQESSPGQKESALPLDVFVIGEKDPAEIVAAYAQITGFAEMPPLWSLGYQQSYRTLGTLEEILQEAKDFREKKLPCDVLIYLGTGFCPEGWNTDNGEFTWNPKAFPDPAKAIETLHAENFHVVLHVVVEGHKLTGTVHDPCTAAPLSSGRTADHHWPPDRQVSCYWPVHKPLLDIGVDGWWPDQGDGFNAPSRLARNRMYFEGQQMYRPNQRVYALHRNAYAGMQRYASFLWSGDVLSRWETLKTHVPNAINTGLSGIPYWGTDIGGFIPTQEYTGELYTRWFQFSAFCPLFRSHGRDWKLHRPWGWDTGEIGFAETASYHPDPAELHNPLVEPICRKYLELRYQLMPYLYTAVRQTCDTGLPVMRALWLHYPDDAAAVACGDEYLFGRDILVAPVVEKGAASRAVYLPKGIWHDFWTQAKHDGGRKIVRDVDLATIPLYVRAGAVIPMGPAKQYTSENVEGPITLTIYPGADGASFLYEDDGESFNYRNGEFRRLEMRWNDRQRQLTLQMAHGTWPHKKRSFEVRIAGQTSGKRILFDGRPQTVTIT